MTSLVSSVCLSGWYLSESFRYLQHNSPLKHVFSAFRFSQRAYAFFISEADADALTPSTSYRSWPTATATNRHKQTSCSISDLPPMMINALWPRGAPNPKHIFLANQNRRYGSSNVNGYDKLMLVKPDDLVGSHDNIQHTVVRCDWNLSDQLR